MSGAVSAVTKVFKKITKSVVGKVVLAAAVSYFTAGLGASFLGATGLAGSLSPTLGTVLSHAISGAVAGGITSGLTGGNIGQGLMFGGFGGAVTGGVQSALGNFTPGSFAPEQTAATDAVSGTSEMGTVGIDAGANAGPAAQPNAVFNANVPADVPRGMDAAAADSFRADPGYAMSGPAAPPPLIEAGNIGVAPGGVGPSQGTGMLANAANMGAQTPATVAPTATGDKGVLASLGDFANKNPAVTVAAGGALMQGVGSGMLAKASADAEKENAERKIAADKERLAGISASHTGGSTGLLTPEGNTINQAPRPKPAPSQVGAGAWVYSPEARRVVWVPN